MRGIPKIRYGLGFAIVVALAAACGGPTTEQRLVPEAQAVGVVRVPTQQLSAGLVVQTWLGRYPVDELGNFEAAFPDIPDNRFAFVTRADRPDKPLYYGYYFPPEYDSELLTPFVDRGEGVVVDARSTALTMVLVNPLLFDSTVDQRAMVAEEALQHPQFPVLVQAIADLRSIDADREIGYETTPDLFFLSSRITIDSMRAIAERLPDRPSAEVAPVPQGVSYDYDMAYPQNEGGNRLKFINPKMAHYVAGLRPLDNPDWSEDLGYEEVIIPGKERWLDISIFPPKIEVVPPTETPFDMPLGPRMLYIYKGFQFDFPFNELWATPPARDAMLANAWAAWNMMIALAGDISNILFPNMGGFLHYLSANVVDADSFDTLWATVRTRDRISTINSMYDVFVAILPALQQHIENQAQELYGNASGGNGIMSQISTLFSAVWSLVSGGSIVNGIIDITTQVIPFYYDLFTAHSYAVYPVYDGQIQPLPDNPTISRVMPQALINGRNGAVYGFDLGANPGKVWITGASGEATMATVLVWRGDAITFKVPANETGFDPGDGSKVVWVQVEKEDGTLTNALEVPFRYVEGGGDGGGGGGCSLVPGATEGVGDGWLVFVLVVAGPWWYRRRRCRV